MNTPATTSVSKFLAAPASLQRFAPESKCDLGKTRMRDSSGDCVMTQPSPKAWPRQGGRGGAKAQPRRSARSGLVVGSGRIRGGRLTYVSTPRLCTRMQRDWWFERSSSHLEEKRAWVNTWGTENLFSTSQKVFVIKNSEERDADFSRRKTFHAISCALSVCV